MCFVRREKWVGGLVDKGVVAWIGEFAGSGEGDVEGVFRVGRS